MNVQITPAIFNEETLQEGGKNKMIFLNENNKNKFYVQAKQAYGNKPNKKNELVEFFKTCD